MRRSLKTSLIVLTGILIVIGLIVFIGNCPEHGFAMSREMRDFYGLKNRTAIPVRSDFDDRVTLVSMVQQGEDQTRWSVNRAASVEGYVVAVAKGPMELTNCYSPFSHDTHIHVALRPNAPPREQVVLEVTPRIEAWARSRGWDWSAETLRRNLLSHWCRFEGWLLFDRSHAGESENTMPAGTKNWRATAWEIHPITYFEVIR